MSHVYLKVSFSSIGSSLLFPVSKLFAKDTFFVVDFSDFPFSVTYYVH